MRTKDESGEPTTPKPPRRAKAIKPGPRRAKRLRRAMADDDVPAVVIEVPSAGGPVAGMPIAIKPRS